MFPKYQSTFTTEKSLEAFSKTYSDMRGLNLSVSSLKHRGPSASPLFIALMHLSLTSSRFSFFTSPLLYNSLGRISSISFQKGLSAAIYYDSAEENNNFINMGTNQLVLSGIRFVDVTDSKEKGLIIFKSPEVNSTLIDIEKINIANCHLSAADSSLIYVESPDAAITNACIFQSTAKDCQGIKIYGRNGTTISNYITYVECDSPDDGNCNFYFEGAECVFTNINCTSNTLKANAAALKLIHVADIRNPTVDVEFSQFFNYSNSYIIDYKYENSTGIPGESPTLFKNIIFKNITSPSIINVQDSTTFVLCYFIDIKCENGIFKVNGDAEVSVSKCEFEIPLMKVGPVKDGGGNLFERHDISYSPILFLNMFNCDSEEVKSDDLLSRFRSDEIVPLIVSIICAGFEIAQLLFLLFKHSGKKDVDQHSIDLDADVEEEEEEEDEEDDYELEQLKNKRQNMETSSSEKDDDDEDDEEEEDDDDDDYYDRRHHHRSGGHHHHHHHHHRH